MEEKDVKFKAENEFHGENDREELFDINSDDNVAGTAHMHSAMREDQELEKLETELKEQKDKYLRLFAEFDNYKRRNAKERVELIQTAGKEVIVSLLDVLDDCDRAEKQLQKSEDINEIRTGVQLVFNKLRSVLQSRGLKAMDAIHTIFDSEKHEAITEIPASSPDLEGKVIDEVTKGYYLNDKLIRFAKVIVGK